MTLRFCLLALALVLVASGCKKKVSSTDDALNAIFYDDFNRADGAPGADWVIVGDSNNTFNIKSNFLHATTDAIAYPSIFYANEVTDPVTGVAVRVQINGGNLPLNDLYLQAKATSMSLVSGGGYLCAISSNHLYLYKNLNQVGLGTVTFSTVNGAEYVLALSFDDETGEVTCSAVGDQSDELTYTDTSPPTGGYYGITSNQNGSNVVDWDDFVIIGGETTSTSRRAGR